MIKYKKSLEEKDKDNSRWLTLYISMILIVLTFFISLSAYSIRTFKKMKKFQRSYSKSLIFSKGKSRGKISITNFGDGDKLALIINNLREKGLSREKMDEYLKTSELIDLGIRSGNDGYTLIVPTKVLFINQTKIDPKSYLYLTKIGYLIKFLPYYAFIEGYVLTGEQVKGNRWEIAAKRALSVYDFFRAMGVDKRKMVVAGFFQNESEDSYLKIRFEKED